MAKRKRVAGQKIAARGNGGSPRGKGSGAVVKIERHFLHLAGEYRVCSELNRRHVLATITYGNHKSADVYAIGSSRRRALKIEVKTSQRNNFVTNMTRKKLSESSNAPDFWVLAQITSDPHSGRFFVLSHKQLRDAQIERNEEYRRAYRKGHPKGPAPGSGVDSVWIEDIGRFEDKWEKIVRAANGPVS
jgi:hypothetical protein